MVNNWNCYVLRYGHTYASHNGSEIELLIATRIMLQTTHTFPMTDQIGQRVSRRIPSSTF